MSRAEMKTMILAFFSIGILGLMACLLKVDFEIMLLISIAYDLIYMRIKNDEEDKP